MSSLKDGLVEDKSQCRDAIRVTPTHLNQTQVAQVKMDMDIKMDGHLVACMKHMPTENKFEWQWHFLEDGPTWSCVRRGQ